MSVHMEAVRGPSDPRTCAVLIEDSGPSYLHLNKLSLMPFVNWNRRRRPTGSQLLRHGLMGFGEMFSNLIFVVRWTDPISDYGTIWKCTALSRPQAAVWDLLNPVGQSTAWLPKKANWYVQVSQTPIAKRLKFNTPDGEAKEKGEPESTLPLHSLSLEVGMTLRFLQPDVNVCEGHIQRPNIQILLTVRKTGDRG